MHRANKLYIVARNFLDQVAGPENAFGMRALGKLSAMKRNDSERLRVSEQAVHGGLVEGGF